MRCLSCSEDNSPSSRFCIYCGKSLTPPSDQSTTPDVDDNQFQSNPMKLPQSNDSIKNQNDWRFILIAIIIATIITIFIVSLVITAAMEDDYQISLAEAHSKEAELTINRIAPPVIKKIIPVSLHGKELNGSTSDFNSKDLITKHAVNYINTMKSIPIKDPGFLRRQKKTYPYEFIRLDYLNIRSEANKKTYPVQIILPKSYEENKNKRYPFLILLGGASQAKKNPWASVGYWTTNCHLPKTYNKILAGEIPKLVNKYYRPGYKNRRIKWLNKGDPAEMIIILPHTYPGPPNLRYKKYLLQEMLPQLRFSYRLTGDKDLSGIDGACLGGAQALMIGLANSDVFHSIGGVEPNLLDFGKWIRKLLTNEIDKLLGSKVFLTMNTATWDLYKPYIKHFEVFSEQQGLSCNLNIFTGGHDYKFYRGAGGLDLLLSHGLNYRDVALNSKECDTNYPL